MFKRPFQIPDKKPLPVQQTFTSTPAKSCAVHLVPAKAVSSNLKATKKGQRSYCSDGSDSDFDPESESGYQSCDTEGDAFGNSDDEAGSGCDDDDDDDDDAVEYKKATRAPKIKKQAGQKKTVDKGATKKRKGAPFFPHDRKSDMFLRDFVAQKPNEMRLITHFKKNFHGCVMGGYFAWTAAHHRWLSIKSENLEEKVYPTKTNGYSLEQRDEIREFCAQCENIEDKNLIGLIFKSELLKSKMDTKKRGPSDQCRYVIRHIKTARARGEVFFRPELRAQLHSLADTSSPPRTAEKRAAPAAPRQPPAKRAMVTVSTKKAKRATPLIGEGGVVVPFVLDGEAAPAPPVVTGVDDLVASVVQPSHEDDGCAVDTCGYHAMLPTAPPVASEAVRSSIVESLDMSPQEQGNLAKAVKFQSLRMLRNIKDSVQCDGNLDEISVQDVLEIAHHTDLIFMLRFAGISDSDIYTLDSVRASALVVFLISKDPDNPLYRLARSTEVMDASVEENPKWSSYTYAPVDDLGSDDEYDIEDVIDGAREAMLYHALETLPPATPAFFQHSVLYIGHPQSDLINGDILNRILDMTTNSRSQAFGGKNILPVECREEYVRHPATLEWYFVFRDRPFAARKPLGGSY